MAENKTNLQEIEVDVDGFPIIGGGNVVTPPQSSVFKRQTDDFNFDPDATEDTTKTPDAKNPEDVKTPDTSNSAKSQQDDLLNSIVTEHNGSAPVDDRPVTTGKPKTDKSALVEYIKDKIESKDFVTFDDYDEKLPIDEYLSKLSNKDLNVLIDENLKLKEDNIKKEVPTQFYNMLPEDFKLAYEYIANGGTDLKGLYKALGEVQEIKDLDPSKESDQKEIVSEYLRNAYADWTEEEVRNQVEEWEDLNLIDKKAVQFKPKLDKIKEQYVQSQIEEQKQFAEQRRKAAEQYVQNVYEALKPSEIGGIKIDSKTQSNLYNGLVNANYKSISGGNTNMLGHLLEKYQYQEPNYQKIAKVLWLLQDEESYEAALIKKGANAKAEETARKLKTTQGDRSSSVSFDDGGNASRATKITRPVNPFSR